MAAASEREIIREFLVSLGFQVEPIGARRFVDTLANSSKLAAKAGATIAGVAVAAETMVQIFARGMEKMFYSSKRTKASVENIQAMQFAFKQIGLDSEDALAALESFSQGLRLNPGLEALLNNLGVKTTGADRVQTLYNLVEKLASMPHFVGAQWAEQFGIPENVFLQMKQFLPQLKAAHQARLEMQRESGLDATRDAAVSREYLNMVRQIWERVELLGNSLKSKLLPYFREFAGVVNEVLRDFQSWTNSLTPEDIREWTTLVKELVTSFQAVAKTMGELWDKHGDKIKAFFWVLKTGAVNTAKALIGLLDALLLLASGQWLEAWDRLKQAGSDLLAPPTESGATPPPASGSKQGQRIPGFPTESPEERIAAAVRRLAILEGERQGGDNSPELQQEIDRTRSFLSRRGYAPAGAAGGANVTFHQKTDIRVDGSGSPEGTARAVGREQGRVNSDLTRNLSGAVR